MTSVCQELPRHSPPTPKLNGAKPAGDPRRGPPLFRAPELLKAGGTLAAILGVLLVARLHSYVLFHSLAECFSIVVGVGVFFVAWHTRRWHHDGYLTFVGVAFLWVAALDLLHTLAYKGMGVFPHHDSNLPTQLWVAARGLEGLALLAATGLIGRRVRAGWTLAGFAVVFAILLASIFAGPYFPTCFVEGTGLTPFKRASECVIAGVLLLAMAALWSRRSRLHGRVLIPLLAALAVTIAQCLVFTLYRDPYNAWNFAGHVLKIVACFCVYKAVVETGLARPHELLFYELKQSEQRYRALFDQNPDGVFALDAAGRYILANPACETISGYSLQEFKTMTFLDLCAPDQRAAALACFQEWFATGTAANLETAILRKDGRRVELLISGGVVRSGDRPVALHCAAKDITARQHYHQRLQQLTRHARCALWQATVIGQGHWNDPHAPIPDGQRFRWEGHVEDEAACRAIFDPPQAPGESYDDAWDRSRLPEDRARMVATANRALQEGRRGFDQEFRCRDRHGQIQWLQETVTLQPTGPGRWQAFGVVLNITQRRQAEDALQRTTDLLDLAERAGHVGSFQLDVPTGHVWLSRSFLLLYGLEEAWDSRHDTWLECVHPQDRAVLEGTYAQVFAARQGEFDLEFRIVRPDGQTRWIEGRAQVTYDPHGRPLQITGVNMDITERKRLEDALKFLVRCGTGPGEDFFQALALYLAQSLQVDFVCIDRLEEGLQTAQTLAVYCNGRFEDNISYALQDTPCGEVVGRTVCCFPEGVRHKFPKDQVLQDMHAEGYVGTTLWNAQGQPIGLIAAIGRQPLAQASFASSLLQLVAVRAGGELERRQADAALAAAKVRAEQAQAAAEGANRAKDQFLAVLSHEMRTPLTPVLATTTALLRDASLPAGVQDDLKTIQRNAELEARLIDDLLDVSRLVQGKLTLVLGPVDVLQTLLAAHAICQADLQAKELHWHADLQASGKWVRGDAARLQQIWWNLLKNAIKFTPPGGTVTVRARNNPAGRLVVTVQDTGMGIDPAALPVIFHAFAQADSVARGPFGGLGLGLAITQALVEQHGGTIRAESPGVGQGATFTVELPTIAAPLPSAPARGRADPARPARHLRILLVEDNPDTNRVMARLLAGLGHEVARAHTLAEGLHLATSQPFDLLLSDVGLPDGSGLDLMRQIRRHSALPGIALTGFGMDEDIRQSREAGFQAHLTKPVNFALLEATIRQIADTVADAVGC